MSDEFVRLNLPAAIAHACIDVMLSFRNALGIYHGLSESPDLPTYGS